MMPAAKFLMVLGLLCFVLFSPVSAQDSHSSNFDEIDWSNPDTIDPYRADVGDFLDVDLDALAKKANEAYQAGDYEEAAKYYLAVVRYDIHDGSSIYNLACCYGLLGDAELAAKYVTRAVNAGFEDIGHIRWDPDFEKVRGTAAFDEAIANLASMLGEKESKLGGLIYFDSRAFFRCRIHLPDNFDPSKSYPLIVGLHGYGSDPDRFITLWERFKNHDFIYASPQGPYPFSVGKDIGYSWENWMPEHPMMSERAMVMSEKYIAGVVTSLCNQYKVNDVYLLGFSQGCAFTYMTGIKYYALFKGLICFGGWLNTDMLSEEEMMAAKDLRVFIAHGTEDRMVEYETGVKAKDTLEGYGYDVTFHEFKGPHAVPEDALQKAEEWMKNNSCG